MDAKSGSFKVFTHTFLYLHELGMFPKHVSFKVLFGKMSGLQKLESICPTSLGIIRLEQE